MTLQQILHWITGAGAGLIASLLLDRWPQFAKLPKQTKRFASLALTFLLGGAAMAGIIGLGLAPLPLDALAWVNVLLSAGFAAVVAGQGAHGFSLGGEPV